MISFLLGLRKWPIALKDDRRTGANPRYPLIEDLKQLLLQAYSSGDTSEVDRQLTVV